MLLVPMLKDRVEKSKVQAAQDEMRNIALSISLAYAQTNRYFRLQDLDNLSQKPTEVNDITDELFSMVPIVYYDHNPSSPSFGQLFRASRPLVARTWEGPYTNVQKSARISELNAIRPNILSRFDLSSGAVYDITLATAGPIAWFEDGARSEEDDLYPLDPWGNPYLFFPAVGSLEPTLAGPVSYPDAKNINFHNRPAIFCMGPNGMPGNLADANASEYKPENNPSTANDGHLGFGDDLHYKM
jgi:hypothetical protein